MMQITCKLHFLILAAAGLLAAQAPAAKDDLTTGTADGYRGIWYMNQPTADEYVYKYSGGFGTYPQQHAPIAIYAPAVRKTFFVYGGSAGNVSVKNDELQHMIGYYDHRSGTVPRPVRIVQKRTEDAHDNPTLSIDAEGYLYVFSSAHGTSRPSYIHRSRKPYDITAWDLLQTTNFSYTQPWYLPDSKQFLFLHTLYKNGERTLNFKTSPDAKTWTEPSLLAHIQMGDYQVSWRDAATGRVATAFDMHPSAGRAGKGLNYRTNLYYLETRDAGKTWTSAAGRAVALPLTAVQNTALVHDYLSEDRNVYIKDIAFQKDGKPVILFLTSKGFEPGPKSGPYEWQTARWTGRGWTIRPFTTSDHNYDHGSLFIESENDWRIMAPTDPGPQPNSTGGELVLWISGNQGKDWNRMGAITHNSYYNHTYLRKVLNANPEFYAIWADGNPLKPSTSSLYFCTSDGRAYRLPQKMAGDLAEPVRVEFK